MRLFRDSIARKVIHHRRIGIRYIQTVQKTPQALQASGPARTRFAPSPTGDLHLGSLRTALFNYLIAKATGGQFLLRLEDTDQKRTVQGAEERLYNDLRWAGIEWDEGPLVGGPYGPYRQSERTELYRQHASTLLGSGNAYRCFCSQERLRTLAEHKSKLGLPADYDRTCAHISREESDDRASKGESHVVRLRVPDKYPLYEDLVYGIVKQRKSPVSRNVKVESFEDPILLKTDGFPTYHLANVVDDHLMKITHVMRGTEWMSSTPKHLSMYEAFGWTPPKFAHVGLLVDLKKQKLSKRTGSIDIAAYRNQGVFPEALTNFVALLGWSHYEKSDVMSLEDLVKNFTLKFTKGDATVSFGKLDYLQRRHATRYAGVKPYPPSLEGSDILEQLAIDPILTELGKKASTMTSYQQIPIEQRRDYVKSILKADIANYTFPTNFIDRNIYFFTAPSTQDLFESTIVDDKLTKYPVGLSDTPDLSFFHFLREAFHKIPPGSEAWTKENIHTTIESVTKRAVELAMKEANAGDSAGTATALLSEDVVLAMRKSWKRLVLTYIRWALVCRKDGPDTTETVRILGRQEVCGRLEKAEGVLDIGVGNSYDELR